MRKRALRILLMLVVAAVQAAAVAVIADADRRAGAATARLGAFERQIHQMVLTLAELRAALQSYVAAGQGQAVWTDRAATLRAALDDGLVAARPLAASASALRELDTAGQLAITLGQLDTQARAHLAGQQELLASDIVFGEAREGAAACQGHVEEALAREEEAVAAEAASFRWREILGLAVVLAAGLVGLATLALGAVPAEERPEPLPSPVAPEAEPEADLDLVASSRQASAPASEAEPAARPLAEPPVPSLTEAAALCVDLARAAEPAELPGLIARVASVLGASGVIVWVADSPDGPLTPVLAHGYAAEALARMGPLPRDADNATASAVRTGELQTVTRRGQDNGAIVAPLLTPSGCVGAMAAEVGDGREASAAGRAVAMMIAAQLATLVGSPAPVQTMGA